MALLPKPPQQTVEAINKAWHERNEPNQYRFIRGSGIGHKCTRHIWYKWRWAHKPEQFEGRMLRLFNTGHHEEDRMVEWLRMAGVTVDAVDPDTKKQWRVEALDGHFVGHSDGILTGVIESEKIKHLFEAKTHNDKSFRNLIQSGVEVSNPEHVDQMQIYMHLLGLDRAFYLAKNKNNDDLYSERIHYNFAHASALINKADYIKNSSGPTARVSDKPDYFLCKAFKCPSYGVCHENEQPLRNCRTCFYSSPIANAEWHCERHKKTISYEEQLIGCPNHLYLPSLIDGELVEVSEIDEVIKYKLPNGEFWSDGGEE